MESKCIQLSVHVDFPVINLEEGFSYAIEYPALHLGGFQKGTLTKNSWSILLINFFRMVYQGHNCKVLPENQIHK